MLPLLAVIAFAALAEPASAHEPSAGSPGEIHSAQMMPGHDPRDCYCRANGRTFAVGEAVCLRTSEGPKIAECEMVLNVTSWGITSRSCPET